MKLSLIIKCNEATHVCDKAQYKEASFWEKVSLNIHIIYCRLCRKHTIRNRKLTQALKRSDIRTFPEEQKKILKERLRQEMIQ